MKTNQLAFNAEWTPVEDSAPIPYDVKSSLESHVYAHDLLAPATNRELTSIATGRDSTLDGLSTHAAVHLLSLQDPGSCLKIDSPPLQLCNPLDLKICFHTASFCPASSQSSLRIFAASVHEIIAIETSPMTPNSCPCDAEFMPCVDSWQQDSWRMSWDHQVTEGCSHVWTTRTGYSLRMAVDAGTADLVESNTDYGYCFTDLTAVGPI